jgi:hypothetical protein
MSEFHIKYVKGKISIDTTSSRYATMEEIVLRLGCYLIDKGKEEEMKSVLDILSQRLEGGD